MDILGAVVNVAHLTRRVVEVIQGARDASSDRERLTTAVFSASGVIATFQVLAQSSLEVSISVEIAELLGPQGALTVYQELLLKVIQKSTNERHKGRGMMKKLAEGFAGIKWSWEKKVVESLITEIGDIKSSLNLILSNIQVKLGRAMLSTSERLEKKLDSVLSLQHEVLHRQQLHYSEFAQASIDQLCNWLSTTDVERQLKSTIRAFGQSQPSWYLEDDVFRKWESRKASSSTLWCPGHPGAGKTILAACIAHHMRRKHESSNTGVVAFFCNYKSQLSSQQSATSIVRSLCRQLLSQFRSLRPSVEEFQAGLVGIPSNSKGDDSDDFVNENSLLEVMMSRLDATYIIIDAWDELGDREKTLLRRSLNTALGKVSSARLLVTSRNSQGHLFPEADRMEIVARDQDVEKYLRLRLDNIDPLSALNELSKDELKIVTRKITDRSSGLFLVAKGHMDTLEECERRTNLRVRIDNLSFQSSLTQIYDDAWARILDQKEDRRVLGSSALLWVVRAKRVLNSQELLHAIAASTSQWTDVLDENEVAREKDLLASCGGLIVVDPETKLVTIHQSLQEYFERGQKSFHFPKAEREMAAVCLKYLRSKCFKGGHCMSNNAWEDRLKKSPFLEYAAHNWGWHVKDGGEMNMMEEMLELFESPGNHCTAAQALCRSPNQQDQISQSWLKIYSAPDRFPENQSPVLPSLHLALYFGLQVLLEKLLDKGYDVNQQASDGKSAIYVATMIGPSSALELLLERGGDASITNSRLSAPLHVAGVFNLPDRAALILKFAKGPAKAMIISQKNYLGNTPLHMAAAKGFVALVQFLLDEGADISSTNNDLDTPLHRACEQSDASLVKLLLDRGALPMAVNKLGELPMHLAAAEGCLESIRLLYSTEDGPSSLSKTTLQHKHLPIHEATMNGRRPVIAQLVKWGVSVDSLQWTGGTPFYQACEFGRPLTAKHLLDLGANPLIPDKWGRTALDIALNKKRSKVVEFLLKEQRCSALLDYTKPDLKAFTEKAQVLDGQQLSQATSTE